MQLEREEFVVTFDAARASVATLLATIKEAGYTAQVVDKKATATNHNPTNGVRYRPSFVRGLNVVLFAKTISMITNKLRINAA